MSQTNKKQQPVLPKREREKNVTKKTCPPERFFFELPQEPSANRWIGALQLITITRPRLQDDEGVRRLGMPARKSRGLKPREARVRRKDQLLLSQEPREDDRCGH